MSQRTVKAAVRRLIEQNINIESPKTQVLERYPRFLSNSDGRSVILWCRSGHERRMAGSGRSAGPIQGVKSLPWNLQVHIVQWGETVEGDYDNFEDFVDKLLELFRLNSILPGGADDVGGSVVLNFGEEMDIENLEPEASGQFMKFQTFIGVRVEEIYNA